MYVITLATSSPVMSVYLPVLSGRLRPLPLHVVGGNAHAYLYPLLFLSGSTMPSFLHCQSESTNGFPTLIYVVQDRYLSRRPGAAGTTSLSPSPPPPPTSVTSTSTFLYAVSCTV